MQKRYEHFVQRHAQNGRFIGRFACVGGMVNRVFTHGDALDRKHREMILLVVIAGVVAVWAFQRGFIWMNHTFQYDFCTGRHLQIVADTFHQLRPRTAQQSGKLVFAQGIGNRRYRAQNGGRVAAEHDGDGIRRIGIEFAEFLIIQRAAAMRQPAHNQLVFADELLAVNAQILAFFVRSARDGQAPCYQRRNVFRPAMLNRKLIQINVFAFPHDFLTRRVFHHVRRHAPNIFQQRQFGKCVFDTFGRFGFFQIRQRLPDFAQLGHAVRAHAHRHTFGRAEQVCQHGIIVARTVGLNRVFKQQRRPFGTQHAIGDFGHFQMRGHRMLNALEFAISFQSGDKFSQISVFHDFIFLNRPSENRLPFRV